MNPHRVAGRGTKEAGSRGSGEREREKTYYAHQSFSFHLLRAGIAKESENRVEGREQQARRGDKASALTHSREGRRRKWAAEDIKIKVFRPSIG